MLSKRSEKNLKGVHEDLVRVVRTAAGLLDGSGLGFEVIEGLRSKVRQQELVDAGASQTMNSRHLTGHAVDLMATVNGKGRWDWALYPKLAAAMRHAALSHQVQIVWGGDWKRFKDGPHFELDRSTYP